MARATPSTRLNLEVECVCSARRREYFLVNVLLLSLLVVVGKVALGDECCAGLLLQRGLLANFLLLLSLSVVIIGEACGLKCSIGNMVDMLLI